MPNTIPLEMNAGWGRDSIGGAEVGQNTKVRFQDQRKLDHEM